MIIDLPISTIIPESVLKKLHERSDELHYNKGQLVYVEGSTPLGAFFVLNGKVKISKLGIDGKEQVLRIAGPKHILNFTDMITGKHYSNSTKVLEESTLLFLPKTDFWELMKHDEEVYNHLMQLLSRHLKEAEQKITDLAYKPVRGRLADALLSLTEEEGTSTSVCISLSRADLAAYVGTAKETVNRLISEFRNEALLTTDGKTITIKNPEGLKMVCNMYN